ncbi:unnamed protein product, partial [Brassica rapa subsp. narinosa]
DKETSNFRELNHISTRKNQIVIITSIILRNYHSQPHMDRASTLTTILISYNASKRGIN